MSHDVSTSILLLGQRCWIEAGESVDVILTGGSLTDLYGYDDGTYTIYVAADGFGMLVTESDETNNVGMIDVVNSNPLANSSFNVWRDYVEAVQTSQLLILLELVMCLVL